VNTNLSRRKFFNLAAAATAAAAVPILTEPGLARAQRTRVIRDFPPGSVRIDSNENPLGPCSGACAVMSSLLPEGGRYDDSLTVKLVRTFSELEGLKPEYIRVYAGSSEPLHYTVMALTSKERSLVVADPSYEAPTYAAQAAGARIIKVPLTSDYAHDVKAMVAADPNAGVFYICNPNNPTGTITSRQDILWALDNKPRGSVLLVDEAYIHLSDSEDVLDQVAAGKDIIVLRTFSKVYGMAGLRCGLALGRPDLLAKLLPYGMNAMPVTGSGAANASLLEANLVPQRKKIIADTRKDTIVWLQQNGYKVIGEPQSNCFMINTGRDGRDVMLAMRQKNVYIGRTWPVWPSAVRISVGTPDEMEKFKVAFKQVMDAPPGAATHPQTHPQLAMTDGVRPPHFTGA
jgi:histidinol-phosphate aminotransferase